MGTSSLLVLGLIGAAFATTWLAREWRLRQHRLRHWALFHPDRDLPKLQRWTEQILKAFPELAALPELDVPAFPRHDRQTAAMAAISLAAERFGYPLANLSLQLGPHPQLPSAIGVAEVPANTWSWRLDGDQIYFVPGSEPDPTPRRIHLTESAFDSDDKLAWVAAHEVAHVALGEARLARPGHENEEITDLATVLAGYGKIFVRQRYVEERYFASGGRLGWRISTLGTLSQPAIAFVRELRVRAAAGRAPRAPAA